AAVGNPAAPGPEDGPASRNARDAASGWLLLGADGVVTLPAAGGDALAGLRGRDLSALVDGETLTPAAESTLALVVDADGRAVTPLTLPRALTDGAVEGGAVEGGAAEELALQVQLPGHSALAAAAGPGAAGSTQRQAAPVTPPQLLAPGSGQGKDPVALPPTLSANPDGEALTRSGMPIADAIAFDPGASQRAVAARQGRHMEGQPGRADDGLRQMLAGASLDRAGNAQRTELAMTAQATAASNDAEAALLAAAVQRGGEDVRQAGRASDTASLIAGVGASTQAVNGQDQPGRPPPLLNLLAAPSDPEFAPEFAGRLQMMVKNGVREANVQLHPAELGRLQLTVSTDGDQARIVIVAESAAARDAIEQSMPRLRDMLEQSGLQLAQGDVSQRERDRGDGAAGAASPGNLADFAAEPDAAGGGLSVSLAASDRLLDAYV
ncbi:MAG: flagellar hook-length control protein FliK, partial [Chromatocurvus sp.]